MKMTLFLFYLLSAAYLFSCINRISAGVVMPYLAETQGFSAVLVGMLSSLYFYSYGLTQNVWGAVNDRMGPLRACAAGMLLAGIGLLASASSPAPLVVGLSRVVCGLGLGAVFTGVYLYAAVAFPPEEYPFWLGILQIAGNLGTVVGVSPVGWLLDRAGYRGLNLVLASVAFVMAFAFWTCRRCLPPMLAANMSGRRNLSNVLASLVRDVVEVMKLVLSDRRLRIAVFIWCASCGGLQALQGLWGVSWVAASSGVGLRDARFWTTLISVGLVVGSPLGARVTYLVDGRGRRLAFLLAVLCLLWGVYMGVSLKDGSAPWMGVAGFLIGLLSGIVFVFCGSTIKMLAPPGKAGAVIGTANMLIILTLVLFQTVTGLIIDRFPGALPGVYLNRGYIAAFVPVLLSIVLSTFSVLPIRSFRPQDGRGGNF